MDTIRYIKATAQYIEGILDLQQLNLPNHLDPVTAAQEGFVTLQHDIDVLTHMMREYPQIIALDNDKIIGYALAMGKDLKHRFDVLVPIWEQLDAYLYHGVPLAHIDYVLMGQVCIAADYRGQGIFIDLYNHYFRSMRQYTRLILTIISTNNPRSMRAHQKVGFNAILDSRSQGKDWIVVMKELD